VCGEISRKGAKSLSWLVEDVSCFKVAKGEGVVADTMCFKIAKRQGAHIRVEMSYFYLLEGRDDFLKGIDWNFQTTNDDKDIFDCSAAFFDHFFLCL
jgi:hypothetical protein